MRFLILPALVLFAAAPALAQVSGIGYRLSPSGSYVLFEGDAGLDEALLYGGALGLSFGEFVELGGLYLYGDTETDFSDFSDVDDERIQAALADLPARDVSVERYGGELKLNLATGALAPFLTGGAGLIRFSPEGRDASRNIYLSGGVGLQLTGADRYALSVQGDVLAYRFNPGRTFLTPDNLDDLGLSLDDFQEVEVLNPSVRAAVQIYLGGRRPGELSDIDRAYLRQFSSGLGGLSLQLTPTYSHINFDEDEVPYRDQRFVGGEVGFDIGPLVGLRGFYARGVQDDDPTNFEDVQMIGGLGRFRLSSGTGFIPYLTLGGGYLNFLEGYAAGDPDDTSDDLRAQPDDRPFALGGLGIELPLSDRFVLSGEARALALSTQDVENVDDPDDVTFNPFYRAGVTFGLGGSAGRDLDVVTTEQARAELESELAAQRARLEAEEAQREAELRAEIARARAEGDSSAVARLQAQADVERAEADVERARLNADAVARQTGSDTVTPVRTNQGDRIITIPLPETGELYVRYGDPGGVDIVSDGTDPQAPTARAQAQPSQAQPSQAQALDSDDELRQLVREALREAMIEEAARERVPGETEADRIARLEARIEQLLLDRSSRDDGRSPAVEALLMERLEDRIEDRIDEQFETLRREMALRDRDRQPVVITNDGEVVTPAVNDPVVSDPVVTSAVGAQSGFTGFGPTLGIGFGDASTAVVGVRVGYRGGPFSSVRFVPELLFGISGDGFFAFNFDGAFDLPTRFALSNYEAAPYVKLGVGILDIGGDDEDAGTKAALNVGLGTDFALGGGSAFAEATTANFGDFNRLQIGYRFSLANY